MANCLSTLRNMTSSQYMLVKKSTYQKEKVTQTSYQRFLTKQKREGLLSDLNKYNTVQK